MNRIKNLQDKIQGENLDAFFLTNTTNVYFFTNFFSRSAAYLLAFPEGTPIMIVPELEYEEAINTVKNSEIIKLDKSNKLIELVKLKLDERKIRKLGIEDASMSVKSYFDISEKIDFIKLEKASSIIDDLRKTKSEEEIGFLQKACEIADRGIAAAFDILEEGKMEIEIAAEIEYEMRKIGSEAIPFDTIVASGVRSAFPHGVSSKKKLNQGDLIIIDLGARYKGYCSDMTRSVVLGTPIQKQIDLYNAVLESQQEAIKACRIGIKASEIDEKAREILSKKDFEEFFVHSLGHGVGLDVHEVPSLASVSEDVLEENMVFTIEPGVYIPDFGGVRIEDVILITKKGVKIITKTKYSISF